MTKMKRYSIVLAVLLVGACAERDPYNPLAANDTYFCTNHHQIVISLGDRAQSAAIAFEGRNVSLDRVDDGSYSNSIYTLYINEDEATLEREGVPVYSGCRK